MSDADTNVKPAAALKVKAIDMYRTKGWLVKGDHICKIL